MEYLLIIVAIPVYFTPTILALVFSLFPKDAQKVFFINFLWGWTGIGWVVALIFAFFGKYEYDATIPESKRAVKPGPKYMIDKQKLTQVIKSNPYEEVDDVI